MNGDFLNIILIERNIWNKERMRLFRVLQRDRTNRICFHLSKNLYMREEETEMDLEELAYTIVGLGGPKSF